MYLVRLERSSPSALRRILKLEQSVVFEHASEQLGELLTPKVLIAICVSLLHSVTKLAPARRWDVLIDMRNHGGSELMGRT